MLLHSIIQILSEKARIPGFECFVVLIMQTLELLEKKEDVLLKKVNAEKEKAIEFIRGKNKRGIGF